MVPRCPVNWCWNFTMLSVLRNVYGNSALNGKQETAYLPGTLNTLSRAIIRRVKFQFFLDWKKLKWIQSFFLSSLKKRFVRALPITLIEFEKKEVSLWKGIQCFPSTLRRGNLKTQKSRTAHFGFVFEENLVGEITSFSKSSVFKMVASYEDRFRKAPFSWWISVDSRPNRKNKTAFSNFSGVERTWPQHSLNCIVRRDHELRLLNNHPTYNNNRGCVIFDSYSRSLQTASKSIHIGKQRLHVWVFITV